jgi:hypothetical protein
MTILQFTTAGHGKSLAERANEVNIGGWHLLCSFVEHSDRRSGETPILRRVFGCLAMRQIELTAMLKVDAERQAN